jgi:hypothetical protein
MIFKKEILDEKNRDYRKLPGVLQLTAGIANDPNLVNHRGVITIENVNAIEPGLLKSLTTADKTLDLQVDGLFYHPQRKKWVIYTGATCPDRKLDTNLHILSSSIQGEENYLKIQFPENEYELVDLTQIGLDPDQIPHFSAIQDHTKIIPIKSEYINLIDISFQHKPTFEITGNIQTVKLYLLGLHDPIILSYPIDRIKKLNAEAFIEVWPNLRGWRTYWVNVAVASIDSISRSFKNFEQWQSKFYSLDASSNLILQTDIKSDTNMLQVPLNESLKNNTIGSVAIKSWPDFIFLSNPAGSLSCLIYNEPPVETNKTEVPTAKIGFDFGSARSVVCIAEHTGVNSFDVFIKSDKKQPLPMYKHRGKVLIDGVIEKRKGESYLGVLTGDQEYKALNSHAQSNESHVKFLMVESKLKVSKLHPLNVDDKSLPFNISSLSVLGSDVNYKDSNIVIEGTNKWDPSPSNRYWLPFFKNIILLTMAEFWSIYTPSTNASISCSSPLAFTRRHHDKYQRDFQMALDWFFNEIAPPHRNGSFYNWHQNTSNSSAGHVPTSTFPESMAAHSSVKSNFVTNRIADTLVLVSDLGGGTLDLSVWLKKMDQPDQSNMILSDSVELGANQLLDKFKHMAGFFSENSIYKHGGGYGMFKNNAPVHVKKNFDAILRSWLDLMANYMARSLAGCYLKENTKNDFNVVLLLAGGGWKTFEFLDSDISWVTEELKTRMVKYTKELAPNWDLEKYLHVENRLHKLGLEKVAIAGGLHNIVSVGTGKNGLYAPNGIDEMAYDQKDISWNTFVDHNEVWKGAQPKVVRSTNGGEVFLPKITIESHPHILEFNTSELGILNGSMDDYVEGGKRKITYAALVFKHALKKLN